MTDVTLTPTLTISATAPSSPTPGDLWWNSAIGVFFVYYDDGSSVQWVTTQPVKYINIAELKAPAGGDLTGYYPDPSIKDDVALEYPVLRNPLDLSDYTQRLASTKWVTDKFASSGVLGDITEGPGILLTPNPLAGDSTIALKALLPDPSGGPFGGPAETPIITVDQYGRVTALGSAAIPPINSPAFTGIPTAPTPGPSTNTTQIATTAFVQTVLAIGLGPYAPINSPTFTGTPSAPTPSGTEDSTRIATTEWVKDRISFSPPGAVWFTGADTFPAIDGTNFFWDDTNNRLGLGIAAPTERLHVVGNILATGNVAAATGGITGLLSALTGTGATAGGVFALKVSSVANFGFAIGSGAPTLSANRGTLYLRSDGPPGPYVNIDGATTWTPVGGNVSVSDTAPSSPLDGQLWWNSVLGSLYIRYNDGNTTQWVAATPAPIVPVAAQYPWNIRMTASDTLSGPGNMSVFRSLSSPAKDYDPNGVWDTANNRFVAPVNGRYAFQLNMYLNSSGAASQSAAYIIHSTSGAVLIRQYAAAQITDVTGYGTHYHIGIELEMLAGERVHFQIAGSAALSYVIGGVPGAVGSMPASGALTWACGHKIGG